MHLGLSLTDLPKHLNHSWYGKTCSLFQDLTIKNTEPKYFLSVIFSAPSRDLHLKQRYKVFMETGILKILMHLE